MAKFINQPIVIEAAGNKPKIIEEYIGTVNSDTTEGQSCPDEESCRVA